MPHFRFHDELNDLLRPDLRDRAFEWPCAERATAKHAIEALGVPHTEVGRVLVDGRPAGLGHLLRATDLLDVFPAEAMRPASGDPAPRFLADAHLGGLARRLRLLGFDTELARDAPDRSLAGLADDDGRIVLSRDRELLKLSAGGARALRAGAHDRRAVARGRRALRPARGHPPVQPLPRVQCHAAARRKGRYRRSPAAAGGR